MTLFEKINELTSDGYQIVFSKAFDYEGIQITLSYGQYHARQILNNYELQDFILKEEEKLIITVLNFLKSEIERIK